MSKKQRSLLRMHYLAYITERGVFESWVEKTEALVLAGQLVGVVNTAITDIAKSSFICRAENSGLFFLAHITPDLHDL